MATSANPPRVALALLDSETETTLREAFRTCGIQTVVLSNDASERVTTDKFQGCAVPLNEQGARIIAAIRRSSLNQKVVVYGILGDDAVGFFNLGINVVLKRPLSIADALNTVRSTCALLVQQLRRYARIPLTVPVRLQSTSETMALLSREIGGGGIGLHFDGHALPEGPVRLSFRLPNEAEVSIKAYSVWKAGGYAGFQFDDADPARSIVKRWTEEWLGIESTQQTAILKSVASLWRRFLPS